MSELARFLRDFLAQFAGGPGPMENNLVRFALPAIMWLVLLIVARNRQRHHDLPREKLLVWGFGLALVRELFMFCHLSIQMLNPSFNQTYCSVVEPVEHALALASIVLIAGAFLRYILDDARLAGRYLQVGFGAVVVGVVATALLWPGNVAANPTARFHETPSAWLLHILASAFLASAIVILVRKQGWLRNVVIVAFSFLFLGEFLILINYATNRAHSPVLCPIANSFHIWAVPLFAFVYFREQSLEKRHAEERLKAYRDHLEELVVERTAELERANSQLERAAVLEERQRIAANMHDGLAQTLSYMGLKMDQAAELLEGGQVEQLVDEFRQMQRAIGQANQDVRRSIASLQERPQPQPSLQDAVNELVNGFDGSEQTPIIVRDRADEPLFLPPTELEQVTRVLQEALLNARRHAHARNITVRLDRLPDAAQIIVEDDGRGFDPAGVATLPGDHFGLSIIRARAARIGGQIRVDSAPGEGTRLTLAWSVGRTPEKKKLDKYERSLDREKMALTVILPRDQTP